MWGPAVAGRMDGILDRAPDDRVRVLDTEGNVVDGATVPDLSDE